MCQITEAYLIQEMQAINSFLSKHYSTLFNETLVFSFEQNRFVANRINIVGTNSVSEWIKVCVPMSFSKEHAAHIRETLKDIVYNYQQVRDLRIFRPIIPLINFKYED